MRAATRAEFPHVETISTRWMDNDVYGHVNNVQYYSFFDTAVNAFLIRAGVLDIRGDAVVGYVVDSGCSYFAPVAYPDTVHVGLRVARLGNSSVRYELAIFRNDDAAPAAAGHFVHVYVDRAANKSAPIPAHVRAALEPLVRA
jgi:acyl-CoA thioester hydrolase